MKNLTKRLKISLILTALAGCAANPDKVEWRPYKDIDGSIQDISFQEWESWTFVDGKQQKGRHIEVAKAKDVGDIKVRAPLGNLQALRTAENDFMGVLFLHNGKDFNIHDNLNVKTLANGNSFEFYEFGRFRLSHAKFMAKNGICQDFNGKAGVHLLMTSNYYPENSFTDFYTALIDVRLQRNRAPKEIGYTPSFTGHNERLQNELKQQETKNGKNLAIANIKEKASILFNIICK